MPGQTIMQASTNYIYIIFAVAYAVYSIIKAGKKVTASRPTTTTTSEPQAEQTTSSQKKDEFKPVQPPTATPVPEFNPGGEIKKILEDLLGGKPDEKNPEVKVPKSNQKHSSTKPPHHIEHPKIISQPIEKAKPKSVQNEHLVSKPQAVSKKVIAESIIEEEPEVDFDFRQAVIYSEILKRPEY